MTTADMVPTLRNVAASTDDQRRRWREAQARHRAGLVRVPAPCGTAAAYRRHRRNGEDCATCRAAEAQRAADRRKRA